MLVRFRAAVSPLSLDALRLVAADGADLSGETANLARRPRGVARPLDAPTGQAVTLNELASRRSAWYWRRVLDARGPAASERQLINRKLRQAAVRYLAYLALVCGVARRPIGVSIVPSDGATGVPLNARIIVTASFGSYSLRLSK